MALGFRPSVVCKITEIQLVTLRPKTTGIHNSINAAIVTQGRARLILFTGPVLAGRKGY